MFFGALLSAIMSTASGTLLAPSVTLTENVLKRFLPELNDKQFLLLMRCTILVCAIATLTFALYSDASIYEMVGNAYKVTLVAAVVPLFAGLFWKRATTQGALVAIAFGLCSWIYLEYSWTEEAFSGRRSWLACCSASPAWSSVPCCRSSSATTTACWSPSRSRARGGRIDKEDPALSRGLFVAAGNSA